MPGQNALVRSGFEVEEGVPGTDSIYTRFASEDFRMDRPYEPDPNIDASGNETEGDSLKAEGTGTLSAAGNSESFLQLRSSQHGFYEHTEVETGVELWELRDYDPVNDDPVAHYIDSLWFGIWRDQRVNPSEYMALGAKVTEFSASVDANKHLMFEHSLLYLRDRYMSDPAEVAVNAAYAGRWVARGHHQSGNENGPFSAFQISTGGAIGVAELVWGTGADIVSLTSVGATATAVTDVPHGFTTGDSVTVSGAVEADYNVTAVVTVVNATTFTYTIVATTSPATGTDIIAINFGTTNYLIAADWMEAHNADDTRRGTRQEPIQVRPLPETGDIFTVGDTWRVDPASEKPVPVYSARPQLNANVLEVRFSTNGGVSYFTKELISDFSLTMGTPREAKFGIGAKYAQKIGFPDNAKKWWEVSFTRPYDDMDFERALISGTVFEVHAKFYGALIGATAEEDFAEYTLQRMKLSTAGARVSSPGDLPEQVTLRAFSVNNSPLCIEKYQNTVTSIAPA